jgi:multiple sugar transport system permease protein
MAIAVREQIPDGSSPPSGPVSLARSRRRRGVWKRNRTYLFGLSPVAVLLALFFVGPAAWAVWSSFTNRALLGPSARHPEFIGIDNYTRLFHDPNFGTVLLNSLVFVVGSAMIGQFLLGLVMALLLDFAEGRGYRLVPLVYGAVLLAWVNPAVIAGFLWTAMLDSSAGILNQGLGLIGVDPVEWLGVQPMLAVIVVNVWRGTAFTMLIFIGALRTVPAQIYEAARVDGAGPFRRFWDHTLPTLRQTAVLVLLSVTISTFGTFLVIQTLTNGGPGNQTEIIALFAYRTAFEDYKIGYGSTISVVMLAINIVFAVAYLRIARQRTPQGGD